MNSAHSRQRWVCIWARGPGSGERMSQGGEAQDLSQRRSGVKAETHKPRPLPQIHESPDMSK